MKNKLLLIDNDKIFLNSIGNYLKQEGFFVHSAYNEPSAFRQFQQNKPDLVLLKYDMPAQEGLKILERIRNVDSYTHIILLSDYKLDESSIINCHKAGVSQIVNKPLSKPVLSALVNCLLNPTKETRRIKIGNSCLTLKNQALLTDSIEIKLREREVLVLSALLEKHDCIVDREHLLRLIWNDDDLRNNKALDNIIYQLKIKIKAINNLCIMNYYSKGYLLKIIDKK